MMKRLTVVMILMVMMMGERWSLVTADILEKEEACCEPRHVHLSLGKDPGHVHVMWATRSPCLTVKVIYGTSPWRLELKVTGNSFNFTSPHDAHGLPHVHRVTMTDLQEGTTYYYRPLCNNIGTGPFYFQTPNTSTEWSPQILVTGELGKGSELLPLLAQRALSGQYSISLQLGALSDFFSHHNDSRGDQLMQAVQQTAAFVPFMTTPGDYEGEGVDRFIHYTHLFSMPGSTWPDDDHSLWYSFNLGPVHFVSVCSALYLHNDVTLLQQQQQWLKADLQEANRGRNNRPWIVLYAQHPLICSGCDSDTALRFAGLGKLLYEQGVDLILGSHTSGYQRLYPLYQGVVVASNFTNPPAPVHLVLGTASPSPLPSSSLPPSSPSPSPQAEGGGVNSSNSSGSSVGEGSDEGDGGDGSQQELNMAAVHLINGTDPTYGRLHVINATHAHWEVFSGGKGREGEVVDTMWLVQESHGPFLVSDLPQDVEDKLGPQLTGTGAGNKPDILNSHESGSSSHPHPLGDILHAVNSHRHLALGLSLGAAILIIAILLLVCRLRRRRRRAGRRGMVPRRWDTADYKYGKTRLSNDDDFDDDEDFKDCNDQGSMGDGLQTKRLIN